MDDIISRTVYGDYHDPFQVLGAHFSSDNTTVTFRAFQPQAQSVLLLTDGIRREMAKVHDQGLFAITLPLAELSDKNISPYSYQYQITYFDGVVCSCNDPYRFLPQLSRDDLYLFNAGTNYRAYEHLGAHVRVIENVQGVIFRVWAPSARRVSVVGNFNGWDGRVHAARSLESSGIWELFIPGLQENEIYKYEIKTQQGHILLKADPFQFYGEIRPRTGSVIRNIDTYTWNDQEWQKKKRVSFPYDSPISIYEVHPGSWQRDPSDPERFLTFRELADSLIPHVQKLGFTHIEFMPVMEHPLDESWGYQVTSPFSMTSRYGIPDDFMYFVDQCHQQGIGVLLDWVPAHFPKDEHSLVRFDGTALYEHEDPRQGMHPEWGTFIYNYGRSEVCNYLIANALFWLDKYHIDGLRVDAVSSMLYLDYARKDGEWVANRYGGRENIEAIAFLKHLNATVYRLFPGALMVAEESTAFYGISKPTDLGGLGFGFKWNMGWMNDTLSYFCKDSVYRKYHHNNLTFSIMYAFSENFILPLSHDEVVHGKCSLINKMPGDHWQKFANLRLLFSLLWCHPGKNLLFMGGEFGQYSEWYCKQSLDWHLLDVDDKHGQLMKYVGTLNRMYREHPSLWEQDFTFEGFQWLDLEDREHSIISFARFAKNRDEHLVCLFNFTPETMTDYRLGLPTLQEYELCLCSDSPEFGGAGVVTEQVYHPYNESFAQAPYHTTVTVPPLGALLLRPRRESS